MACSRGAMVTPQSGVDWRGRLGRRHVFGGSRGTHGHARGFYKILAAWARGHRSRWSWRVACHSGYHAHAFNLRSRSRSVFACGMFRRDRGDHAHGANRLGVERSPGGVGMAPGLNSQPRRRILGTAWAIRGHHTHNLDRGPESAGVDASNAAIPSPAPLRWEAWRRG